MNYVDGDPAFFRNDQGAEALAAAECRWKKSRVIRVTGVVLSPALSAGGVDRVARLLQPSAKAS
jgi:hypothetical protein